jgi:indole-3-glycerol phosphate synthase
MSIATGSRSTALDAILERTRKTLEQRKRERPLAELEAEVRELEGSPERGASQRRARLRDALTGPRMAVIAEFKRRSPSAGPLRAGADVRELVASYARAGASAVSVLTEGPHFDGSLDDLRAARASCDLPLLRKDFIVDRYQLYEARAAGADAVLLIVAALTDAELRSLHHAARALALDVLVEVHDRPQLRRALAVGPELIGVNNRDLRDFTVDVERTLELMPDLPDGVTVVSESGIDDAQQVSRLEQAGVHAVLVGEALMRGRSPEYAMRALLGSSRASPPRKV